MEIQTNLQIWKFNTTFFLTVGLSSQKVSKVVRYEQYFNYINNLYYRTVLPTTIE